MDTWYFESCDATRRDATRRYLRAEVTLRTRLGRAIIAVGGVVRLVEASKAALVARKLIAVLAVATVVAAAAAMVLVRWVECLWVRRLSRKRTANGKMLEISSKVVAR